MAIQIPNPGTGNGASGDNEFVLWTKVKDNFSNTSHAANKLVGTDTGNVMQVGAFGVGGTNDGRANGNSSATRYLAKGLSLEFNTLDGMVSGATSNTYASFLTFSPYIDISASPAFGQLIYSSNSLYMRNAIRDPLFPTDMGKAVWGGLVTVYTTANTTKDAGTGFLKASSPVLHVYNDKIDKIHEAEQLDITVDKKGVGHYEIHGTTGLRQNDGWNMSPPRDIHGNVRCMIEVTEKDGVITVKTYKRKFDLELAAIVHDYDNPLDIPDGACVELRFNDLPQENLDDIEPKEVDLGKE